MTRLYAAMQIPIILLAGCVYNSHTSSVHTDASGQLKTGKYQDIRSISYAEWLNIVVPEEHRVYQGGSDAKFYWVLTVDESLQSFAALAEQRLPENEPGPGGISIHINYANSASQPNYSKRSLIKRPAYSGYYKKKFMRHIGYLYNFPEDSGKTLVVGMSEENSNEEYIFSIPLLDDFTRRKIARESHPQYDVFDAIFEDN